MLSEEALAEIEMSKTGTSPMHTAVDINGEVMYCISYGALLCMRYIVLWTLMHGERSFGIFSTAIILGARCALLGSCRTSLVCKIVTVDSGGTPGGVPVIVSLLCLTRTVC